MRHRSTRRSAWAVIVASLMMLILAACGDATPTSAPASTGTTTTAAASGSTTTTSGTTTTTAAVNGTASNFNWQQQNGKTLNIALVKHPMGDSIIKNLADFQALTGITVKYEQYSEEEYFQKLLTALSTGQGSYDAFMMGPVHVAQYGAPGWIEPLDKYIGDPAKTASDWDLKDFYPAALGVNMWDKSKGVNGRGQGALLALPVNEEGYSLFYRKDILEKTNTPVPQTFDELSAAVKKLNGYEDNGKKLNGFVARGNKTFPTLTGGFSSVFAGYGATDVNPDGSVAINSPKSIAATQKWAELMQSAPKSVGSYTWYEAMNDFAAGNAVFFIDADHMAETFENGTKSAVAGKVGYAPPPAGPDGTRACGIWLWSLGMASASKNKDAAWLFLQWAGGKQQLEKAITLGNINPTRQSLANSDLMKNYTAKWGNYNQAWQEILSKYAKWRYITSPKFPEMGDRWALAIQQVILNQSSAQDALNSAQKDLTNILNGG